MSIESSQARIALATLACAGVAATATAPAAANGSADCQNAENAAPERGTAARDKLLGTAAGDHLDAAGGTDLVIGLQGNDCLIGGSGGDTLRSGGGVDQILAGGGRDTVISRDGRRDIVRCGPGYDRVKADRRDVLRSCEDVMMGTRARRGPKPDRGPKPEPAPEPTPEPAPEPTPEPPPEPTPGPTPPPTGCQADPINLKAPGCTTAFQDSGAGTPSSVWGSVDCASSSRVALIADGDPGAMATGGTQASSQARRTTVFDGDDFWGERCELGRNDHKVGPTAVFREGDHKVTFASLRLPSSFPLAATRWQAVLQMKQAQPSANGGGTPVLALHAYGGRWRLFQSTSNGPSSDTREIWSAPAQANKWTRFAFDIHYSQNPSAGSIRVYADLNGDGDAADAGEPGQAIKTYTLKYETSGGGDDGIPPGASIPSHLRAGIYHDTSIACSSGCAVDVDNVQVVAAG